jgi:hypothetical protein
VPAAGEQTALVQTSYSLVPIGWAQSALRVPGDAPNQRDGAPEAWIRFDEQAADGAKDLRPGDEIVVLTWLHLSRCGELSTHPEDDMSQPLTGVFSAAMYFADPGAWPTAEELITAVGLEPVFAGDAGASATVDALLPLWFALVRHNDGNRRIALRITIVGHACRRRMIFARSGDSLMFPAALADSPGSSWASGEAGAR